jgi:hypothetical protein
MKKAARVRSIDFATYRVKKNPFAKRVQREGIELIHDGPSPASVREIPELGPARRTAPFAVRRARTATTVELDAATWKKLEERARAAKLPLDEWLRRLIDAVA